MKLRNWVIVNLSIGLLTMVFAVVRCGDTPPFFNNTLRADVFTQSYAVHGYDFLWVLDNSPSMDAKRTYLANNMQTFLDTLNSRKAIDYQMAVTDVDYLSNPGGLISNSAGLAVVASKSDPQPAADFASIVNTITDSGTSFWEQGLQQSYLAITNNGPRFMRQGIPLVIIYVTDDDDWSCKGMFTGGTVCYGIQPENNPDVILYDTGFYINFFKNLKASQSTTTTLFPIVAQASSTCVIERVGMRYMEVANQVGGDTVSGGLCPDTIGTSLNNVAQTIADRGVKFQLSAPVNTQLGLTVTVNGQPIPYSPDNGYIYDQTSDSIIFTGNDIPSNGQIIEVTYTQVQN